MDAALSETRAELPALLRAAREHAGLTRSQLAELMEVSWETVRQAEEGRDPRHSTLLRYVEAMPFLSPRALLLGEASGPPLASPAIWSYYRQHYGFSVRRLTHELTVGEPDRRSTLSHAEGVRPVTGDLRDPVLRTNLMRAVMIASTPVLVELRAEDGDLAGRERTVEAEDETHVFTFPRALARNGFSYRRTAPREWRGGDPALAGEDDEATRDAETIALDVTFPIERLDLTLESASDEPPRVRVFVAPETAVPPLGAFALARALHPAGFECQWLPRRRRLTVSVVQPVPNLRYGLAWTTHGAEAPDGFFELPSSGARSTFFLGGASDGGEALPETLAGRLEAARQREGLSRRELAGLMGVSPATVIAAERGRDPRCSTLRRWVEALPSSRPEDLFAIGEASDVSLSADSAWLYFRNVMGIEAAEATRTLELVDDGSGEESIVTRALRRVHGGNDLIVKDGISQAVYGTVGPVFVEQDGRATEENLRIRWIRVPGEQPEFHLFVPAPLAESGVSFTRRENKEHAYKMRSDQQHRSIGPAYECYAPVGRLVLTVRFPRGYWPVEVRTAVRAAVNITNPKWPDLAEPIHGGAFRVRKYQKTGTVRIQVERPLLGFRYSISWKAP